MSFRMERDGDLYIVTNDTGTYYREYASEEEADAQLERIAQIQNNHGQ